LGFLLLYGITAGPVVAANDYPAKTIKLIVPWAAGGGTDSLMRIVAKYAGDVLGQPVIVNNVGGASGTVGEREAMKAKPDGYTLFSAHQSVSTTYYCGTADINYWDFEPIGLMTSTPSIVATHPGTPWKSMRDPSVPRAISSRCGCKRRQSSSFVTLATRGPRPGWQL
jgi:tripartite-type tricarboxylate transporter receptor subunit TctC